VHDKTSWLAHRGIETPWTVAGLPEALHADNGPDFRSRAFERALTKVDANMPLLVAVTNVAGPVVPGFLPSYAGGIQVSVALALFCCLSAFTYTNPIAGQQVRLALSPRSPAPAGGMSPRPNVWSCVAARRRTM
jgi:hypothetical protein